MPTRTSVTDEAARRAARQLDGAVHDLRSARLAAGLTQLAVARAIGCSPALVSMLERRVVEPGVVQVAKWGAVVGLDIPIRAYAGGSPLRDIGQLRLLRRFRDAVGDAWTWHTEVPVSADPRERRAVDAVLSRAGVRIGLEAIVRLTDAQAQTRSSLLKQEVLGVDRLVLVLARTRHNATALSVAAPTIGPAFPLSSRATIRALRAGELPSHNGVVVI